MSRFKGDGRTMLEALPQYTQGGTMPIRVRRGTARWQIEMFEKSGYSTHSQQGGTLWVIIEHCETSGIGYTVEGGKGFGYYVQRTTKPLP